MNCKNRFCVFNRKPNICIKNNVELNECGCCLDFYYPTYFKGLPDDIKNKFFNPPKGLHGLTYKDENKKYYLRHNVKINKVVDKE